MLLQSCSSFLPNPMKTELVLRLQSEPSSPAFILVGKCCSSWCALRLERTAVCKVIRHQVCIACSIIVILSSWRFCGFDWESSAKERNCFYSSRRTSLSIPVYYRQREQCSFGHVLPSLPHLPPWNTALLYFSFLFYHSQVWVLWSLQRRLQSNCL